MTGMSDEKTEYLTRGRIALGVAAPVPDPRVDAAQRTDVLGHTRERVAIED